MCKKEVLTSDAFLYWAEKLRPDWDPQLSGRPVLLHRKMWEWLFVTQALAERGLLAPGSKGLGFGVGQEPLTALFASLGCSILASDAPSVRTKTTGWAEHDQFATGLGVLNKAGLCDPEQFRQNVSFRAIDMTDLPDDLRGFNFTWSSCALEHLGSLEAGMAFVKGQMRCLAPGGVAVHTTEFNVSSNRRTVDDEMTVLYRKRDLKRLGRELRKAGHEISFDFRPGRTLDDRHVDVPPFADVHLRTKVLGFTTTSFGLIIRCASPR